MLFVRIDVEGRGHITPNEIGGVDAVVLCVDGDRPNRLLLYYFRQIFFQEPIGVSHHVFSREFGLKQRLRQEVSMFFFALGPARRTPNGKGGDTWNFVREIHDIRMAYSYVSNEIRNTSCHKLVYTK